MGFSSFYTRIPRLFHELAIARADGSYPKIIAGIHKDKYFEDIIGKNETAHWDEVKKKIKGKKVQIY